MIIYSSIFDTLYKMEEVKHLACQNDEDCSVLSVLRNGWDSIIETYEHPLLRYFTTKEATVLRSVCSEFKDAVEVSPWDDLQTMIRTNLHDWKVSFPLAISAKINAHRVVLDERLVARLEKIHVVNLHIVPSYLLNIINLQIEYCNQIRCKFQLFIHNE